MVQSVRTIPPGGEGKIALKIETKDFSGRVRKTAKISSNDPRNPEVTIIISGNVWVPIKVSTTRVVLRGLLHEDVTNSVSITGQKSTPLELEIVSETLPEKVSVQLENSDEDNSYLVHFTNVMKAEGFYNAEVYLQTNYVDEPTIKIQVLGAIRSLVEVRPKVLTFGSVRKEVLTQDGKPRAGSPTREVMVYLVRGNDLKIDNVEWKKGYFQVAKKVAEQDNRIRLLIHPAVEKLSIGRNSDFMRIQTNQKHYETIEIPVNLFLTQ